MIARHNWSYDMIARRLAYREDVPFSGHGERTRAAVAMIIHRGDSGLEMLFIQRAAHDLDPWSGHIAFPGGKLEAGEQECEAACRETLEEIGVDLGQGRYLGRLSDIVGANLPIRVSCCLFALDRHGYRPVLNEEVRDLFWVTLDDLFDQKRHQLTSVSFGEKCFDVPAIRLPVEHKPVLWGITYRLVMQFLEILDSAGVPGAAHMNLPAMVDINEGVTEHERKDRGNNV